MLSFATLQVLNLLQTTFLLGFNLTLSFISIPTILLSPSPILAIRQWHLQFQTGKKTATPISASQLILSLILAYGSSVNAGTFATTTVLYGISSFLSFFIFPFTLYYIQPLNEILSEKYRAQLELHYADLPEKNAGMQTARVSLAHSNAWFLFANPCIF
jgi:hypothetical protein